MGFKSYPYSRFNDNNSSVPALSLFGIQLTGTDIHQELKKNVGCLIPDVYGIILINVLSVYITYTRSLMILFILKYVITQCNNFFLLHIGKLCHFGTNWRHFKIYDCHWRDSMFISVYRPLQVTRHMLCLAGKYFWNQRMTWASHQIHKIAGSTGDGNAGNVFKRNH